MTALSDVAIARLQAAAAWPEITDERYSIVEELGRGGMGTVYRARDEAFDRDVAVKVTNALDNPSLEARMRTEARILARLEHPGIVPIHDVGRLADGRLFYVMKLVRGRTLLDHLGPGADLGERLRIFERICEPVAFAHAQGVVHRDLKPANVMIGAFGEVLVLDWGVAHAVDAGPPEGVTPSRDPETASLIDGHTEPGTILGTRGFMAPEQASGAAGAADPRTDIYGLGAILFTLLSGEVPPPDQSARETRLRDRNLEVPRPLRAVCAKAMAPSAGDRYDSAVALADDVARFRTGDPVSAYREPVIERVWRLARKYRVAVLLVLAYLVMRTIVALLVR